MSKVTEEMKQVIRERIEQGISQAKIAEELDLPKSTVSYHSSEEQRRKHIKRAIENKKTWAGKKEYQRKYMKKRYNEDPEFKARVQSSNRKYQRKIYGTK